jgi:hypothetical protein
MAHDVDQSDYAVGTSLSKFPETNATRVNLDVCPEQFNSQISHTACLLKLTSELAGTA